MNSDMFAPVIIMAFNRPESLSRLIMSLKECREAIDTDLYVNVDGPRPDHEGESAMVQSVIDIVSEISGFKSLTVRVSERNKGLGPSIIAGVTEILEGNGMAIILEDDLEVSPGFLYYMNSALETYKDNPEVFSVCAYSNKVRMPRGYGYGAYFCQRSSSWGWGTWKDRWDTVDWNLEPWSDYWKYRRAFNRWGGSDCMSMLERWHSGRNSSWAIRFCFSQFLQDKVSLFPTKSYVINNGFDGNGTNCGKWSRFKCEIEDGNGICSMPSETVVNPYIRRQVMRYHGIILRIWSRIMNMLK